MTREPTYRPSILTLLTVAGLVLVAALVAGGGAPEPAPPGIPDPGPVVGWGIPVLTMASDLLAVAVLAGLLMPLLSSPRVGGRHTLGRLSGARVAGRLAVVWAAVVAGWFWLTLGDQLALRPGEVTVADLATFAKVISQGQAFVVQFVLVALVALLAPWARTFGQVTALAAATLIALVPRILTGHSISSGNHDLAIVALLLHVAAAVVWVAGVLALVTFLADRPGKRELAARRFSMLAGICIGVVAVSGLVSGYVRLGDLGEIVASPYGLLVLAKTALIGGLALLGARLRHRLATGLEDWVRFARLAALELGLMAAAIAVGAGLSRTAPPVGDIYLTDAQSLLGGPLPPAPTVSRVLWSFTPSGVGLLVVAGGLIGYAAGLIALHRRGARWPWWRTAAWLTGLVVVGYATFGGIGTYSHVLFSGHMAAHMLLAMLAPVFLVLGAPMTLALRALPGGARPGEDGPRQVLSVILRSWPFRVVSHPAFVVTMFLVSLYGVYFTSFFNTVMTNHIGHAWMQAHFLISGYLLFELVVGVDPIPMRLAHFARVALMLLIAPFHAFFAIAVMNSAEPIGGAFYTRLDRPYLTDLLADQHYAGSLVWAFGEFPTLLVVLALLAQWFTRDLRDAARFDRREDLAGEDSEWAEYNRKLAAAAAHDAQLAQDAQQR